MDKIHAGTPAVYHTSQHLIVEMKTNQFLQDLYKQGSLLISADNLAAQIHPDMTEL